MFQEPDRQRRDPLWRDKAIAELIRRTATLIELLDLYLGAKFNPGQLRVPAGNPAGGQWTAGDGATDDAGDDPADDEFPLELIAGKTLPPDSIRSLFRDYGGHHIFPLAEAQLRANVLSPDAVEVLSKRTIGGNGELKDQSDPDNPHRGRSTAHRDYGQGVRDLTDRFIRENGIDRNNPMTGDQARKLVDEIENSKDSRLRTFINKLNEFVYRDRPARSPRARGSGRGRARE